MVMEAAVRSWPPVEPLCLKFNFPRWTVADALDPAALKSDKPKTTINQIAEKVLACLREHGSQTRSVIRAKLQISGQKVNEAVELLLVGKKIEPCDIATKRGNHTGYQVAKSTLDNAGQSSNPSNVEHHVGQPKGVVHPTSDVEESSREAESSVQGSPLPPPAAPINFEPPENSQQTTNLLQPPCPITT